MEHTDTLNVVELTAEVASAYLSNNAVRPADVPGLIASLHAALSGLAQKPTEAVPAEPLKPAVPVKKSVTDDFIISLEDGRKMKSMKRYLAGLGMTPADYRQKWGLPDTYPMVAPAYAAKRSELARSIGLGRKAATAAPETAPAAAAGKRRGRAKAA